MLIWKVSNYRESVNCFSALRVYDALIDTFGASEEDAIDAEGWSELATVGEVYQGNNFRIEIEDV